MINLRRPTWSRGFTLVEVLIAALIGSLLLTGALTVLVRSHTAWQTAENLAALEETATFALTALEYDVRLAGNWGLHSNGDLIQSMGNTVQCSGVDVSDWALQLTLPVSATNGSYQLPCPPRTQSVANSDTLTLRFASPTDADSTGMRIASSLQNGRLYMAATPPSDFAYQSSFAVNIRAWYLNSTSSESDSPGLFRYTLMNNSLLQNQEIISGVEDFQVTLGVDRDDDGIIDGFVAPGLVTNAPIKAVRFWLLLRSKQPEPGHIDNGHWHSPGSPAAAKAPDGYRRISAERTVWLRNPAH